MGLAESRFMDDRDIAYFSMEIALDPGMPTYAGGLGVLAGDTVRAAADLGIRMVAVSLLYRKGYFYQRIVDGQQVEEPTEWSVDDFVRELPQRASVQIEGRTVQLRAWQFEVRGQGGRTVPVYFLDSDLPENAAEDRLLTDSLYGGDNGHRLRQEVVLGIGGLRMLRALGHDGLQRFHMNEGHSSLLTLELLAERRGVPESDGGDDDIDAVRKQCVFTTHTPVPAGHDRFPFALMTQVLGETCSTELRDHLGCRAGLNMTELALRLSHYVNGVARKHGEVSRELFPTYSIDSITNGVHAATWTAPPMQKLFDRYVPGWREDNLGLRSALSIPGGEIWRAHMEAKRHMLAEANRWANVGMDKDFFTIGYARRFTPYKRPFLLFSDLERLRAMVDRHGPIQVVVAGKAHPRDAEGKELIKQVVHAAAELHGTVRVAYLENYDLRMARSLVSGVDVWLNTPAPPMEASGTSGMKAALNGVPSLSVLDGWWLEGWIEGVTGWAIGGKHATPESIEQDGEALYAKLDEVVLPLFYENQARFIEVMRHAIALNGAYFNTQRMLQQYVVKAYFS